MLSRFRDTGDIGGTVSPAMVGKVSEIAGGNLKTGLLAATFFPIVMVLGLFPLITKVKLKAKR